MKNVEYFVKYHIANITKYSYMIKISTTENKLLEKKNTGIDFWFCAYVFDGFLNEFVFDFKTCVVFVCDEWSRDVSLLLEVQWLVTEFIFGGGAKFK